jgi:integrase
MSAGQQKRAEQARCSRTTPGITAGVSTHSFRKTVATLIEMTGCPRIGADHLGHAQVSMTQNVYMSQGSVHPQVAELLERVVVSDDGSPGQFTGAGR